MLLQELMYAGVCLNILFSVINHDPETRQSCPLYSIQLITLKRVLVTPHHRKADYQTGKHIQLDVNYIKSVNMHVYVTMAAT